MAEVSPGSLLSGTLPSYGVSAVARVVAQCLCQCRPSALSQAIPAKVERRKRGVQAQCLCQRPRTEPTET
jgi:hypothetical protein